MGLLQKAYETYKNLEEFAGEKTNKGFTMLAPVFHVYKKSDICITIDIDGKFCSARWFKDDKDFDNKLVVPCNSIYNNLKEFTPYVLCTDYGVLSGEEPLKFENYIKNLKEWKNSEFSHPFLNAIYQYVTGNTIVRDLENTGHKMPSPKEFVVWCVVGDANDNMECFNNKTLFNCHIARMRDLLKKDKTNLTYGSGLCYVTGEETFLMETHPQGAIPAFPTAKLLSAGDKNGFIFRGRFADKKEAFGVGCEASWASHNILAWLSSNGSVMVYNNEFPSSKKRRSLYGNRVILCWSPKGKEVPSNIEDIDDDALWKGLSEDITDVSDVMIFKDKLRKVLNGFKDQFSHMDDIVVASFTATSDGRVSLASYNEINALEYFKKFEDWYSTMMFYRRYGSKYTVFTPTPFKICSYALGFEKKDKKYFEIAEKDKGIFGQLFEQINSAMINGIQIPKSVVNLLVNRASKLELYNDREGLLSTACAVIFKYYNFKKEVYLMSLQEDLNDRSYQFGRLLAVMEKVERDVLQKTNSTREPNAMRLQSYYQNRPFMTANTVHNLISPYFAKLDVGARIWYKNLISDIFEKISEFPKNELNRPLEASYLLGYYLQRKALYTKKEKE